MLQPTFCIDIGGSTLVGASVSADLAVGERRALPTPATDLDALCAAVAELAPDDGGALGIAMPCVIDRRNGQATSANVPCVNGLVVQRVLSERLGRPVWVLNDADAFALGEAACRPGGAADTVFAVILGTGVGGAIVVGERLLTGPQGSAGEWGHGPASATRTGLALPASACACGQPLCLDRLGGARGLERLHRHVAGVDAASTAILADWHRGESAARDTVDVWLDIVAGALSAAVNLLDPVAVPVGGGLSRDTRLMAALDTEVRERSLGQRATPLLDPVADAERSALIGAAMSVQRGA